MARRSSASMTNGWRLIGRRSSHPLRRHRRTSHQSSAIFPMDIRTLPSASRQTESWTGKKGKPESFIFGPLNWFQISSNFPPRQSWRLLRDAYQALACVDCFQWPRARTTAWRIAIFSATDSEIKALARRRTSARRFRYTITQMGWKLFFFHFIVLAATMAV